MVKAQIVGLNVKPQDAPGVAERRAYYTVDVLLVDPDLGVPAVPGVFRQVWFDNVPQLEDITSWADGLVADHADDVLVSTTPVGIPVGGVLDSGTPVPIEPTFPVALGDLV